MIRRAAALALWAALAAGCGETGKPPAETTPIRALLKTSMGDVTLELWPQVAPETVRSFLGLAEGNGTFTDNRTGKKVTIEKPFYDGLTFHRVIKGFMIQGGDPNGNGTGDAGYLFDDEMSASALGLNEKVLQQGSPHPLLAGPGQWQREVLFPLLRKMGIDPKDARNRQDEIKRRLETLTVREVNEMRGNKYDDSLPSRRPEKYCIAMANSGPNTNGSQFFINLVDTPHLTGRHTVFGRAVAGTDVVDAIGNVRVGPGSRPVEPVKILSIRRQ